MDWFYRAHRRNGFVWYLGAAFLVPSVINSQSSLRNRGRQRRNAAEDLSSITKMAVWNDLISCLPSISICLSELHWGMCAIVTLVEPGYFAYLFFWNVWSDSVSESGVLWFDVWRIDSDSVMHRNILLFVRYSRYSSKKATWMRGIKKRAIVRAAAMSMKLAL